MFAASIDSHFNSPKINALNFITPSLRASSLLIFAVSSLRAEERTPETINKSTYLNSTIVQYRWIRLNQKTKINLSFSRL